MFHSATVVSVLKMALDASKAIWNRYSLLLLLEHGFSLPQIGLIKFYSIVIKAVLQILIPVLDDNGFFSRCVSPNRSAHVISFTAAICGIPVVFLFQNACMTVDLKGVIAAKCIASVLSCFIGLADGIITRTVQKQELKYSNMQVIQAIAWAGGITGSGLLVDILGVSAVFYSLASLKIIAALCLAVLGALWPLDRNVQENTRGAFCVGPTHLWKHSTLRQFACLFIVWGSCFVVIETFTIIQMDREFAFSKTVTGLCSMISALAGIPVYAHAQHLLSCYGHLPLITRGLKLAILFLLLHALLDRQLAWVGLVICPLRGIAYAIIWVGFMDMIVHEVKNDFLPSVQAIVVFAWFTLGNSIGYLIWAQLYDKLNAHACYTLCAAVLALSLMLMPRHIHHDMPNPRSPYTREITLLTALGLYGVYMLLYMKSNIQDTQDKNPHVHNINKLPLKFTSQTGKVFNQSLDRDATHNLTVFPTSLSKRELFKHMTLHSFIQNRIRNTDPSHYAPFADRLWLNQWKKVARCKARVPRVLAFYDEHNISLLAQFQAPASGAVVKLNHMAGNVKILKYMSYLSPNDLHRFQVLVKQTYQQAYGTAEPHYSFIRRGIIVEEFLLGLNTSSPPVDYKTYAFDGKVAMVRIIIGRHCKTLRKTYMCSGSSIDVKPDDLHVLPYSHFEFPRFKGNYTPSCGWQATIDAAQCLSAGINFARVDMYIVNCEPYIGEFTMTPCGGCEEVLGGGSRWLGSFIPSLTLFPHGEKYALQ